LTHTPEYREENRLLLDLTDPIKAMLGGYDLALDPFVASEAKLVRTRVASWCSKRRLTGLADSQFPFPFQLAPKVDALLSELLASRTDPNPAIAIEGESQGGSQTAAPETTDGDVSMASASSA
jgi:hypothetical protein